MTDKTAVDWKHWGKLKSVMVFEALALLSNSEPSEEPQELEDASPEYRKRHRLLLDSFADRAQFTAGTLNMGNASLNGVSLIEVARWALANGITLPDNFPRPVRVSKAPPPITPLRGSSYIPPKKPQPIDWAHWQLMPMVKLQEAVALSVNVNPDYVTKVDDVLIKRMKIALSHVDAGSLPLEHHYPNLPMSPVSLAKFAAWAVKLNIPDLPAELVAIAATATTAPVVMPAQNTATPAPVVNEQAGSDAKPWLTHDSRDPDPEQPWYTPARYFARQLVVTDSTLLTKKLVLADKVSNSLHNVGIYKRGGKKQKHSADTVLKAFANVTFG